MGVKGTVFGYTPALRMEIIHSLAKNKMNVSATARELKYHRNTLEYHIRKIKETTGKDPLNFYDLAEMVGLVSVEEVNDG